MPDNSNFSIAHQRGMMTYAGRLSLPEGDWKQRVFTGAMQTTYGKDLWFKGTFDSKGDVRTYAFW